MEVSLVYFVLKAILGSLHKSSYKKNNSGIDGSNSFASWTVLPVGWMGMCRKSALSYNQRWLFTGKGCGTAYGRRSRQCSWRRDTRAVLTLLCTCVIAGPWVCLSIFLLILVRVLTRGNRQKRRRESCSLSQKTLVVKLLIANAAHRRAERSGSEVWKWMLSHQQNLTFTPEGAVGRCRRRPLHKVEGWVRMWAFTIANLFLR